MLFMFSRLKQQVNDDIGHTLSGRAAISRIDFDMSGTHNPIIVDCMKKIMDGKADEQKIWANTDMILEQLNIDGLSYKRQIDCTNVGVHKSNRGGFGMTGSDCIERGVLINFTGFRFSACSKICCIEDDPIARLNEKWTCELAAKDEQLARYVQGHVNFASVAGSHINGFFAAAKHERPCSVPELSMNGKLSPAKITENNPQAKDVFENGLYWIVIRWQAEGLYPGLAAALEKGFNGMNLAHKPENQWQLLNRIMAKVAFQPTHPILTKMTIIPLSQIG